MADETKDCCGKYCCQHCFACHPQASVTLWGLPVHIVPEGILPPDPGWAVVNIPRLIKSDDVIEGVCQIMAGKIQMVVTDDLGYENIVKVILERIPK